MECYREDKLIEVTEDDLTRVMPYGKGKLIQYSYPTNIYPDGVFIQGNFTFYKKGKQIYRDTKLKFFNAKTLDRLPELDSKRETILSFDKNNRVHTQTKIRDAIAVGGIINKTDNSYTNLVQGSYLVSDEHYDTNQLIFTRIDNKTSRCITTDLLTGQFVNIKKYFYN